jgi:hypothetical protein
VALLGNYTVLAKNPGKAFSGSTISDNRSQTNKSGANRCRFAGWAAWSPLAAQPNGYLPPYAWVLPIDPGGISSYTLLRESSDLTAAGARGVNGAATITVSSTLDGTAQLVVSGVATITTSGSLSGNVVAALQLSASIAATASLTADVFADGFAIVTINANGTLTLTPYATGELAAEILPYTELSPQSLANAVWAASVEQGDAGTMGEALRLVEAILRNRTITDPVAGTFTVYDDDNTTVLLTGDLWQDAAGTIAYAGAGAERRDRLE